MPTRTTKLEPHQARGAKNETKDGPDQNPALPGPIEEVSRDMGEERVTVNRDSVKVVGSPKFDTDGAPAAGVLAYY